MNKLIKIKYWFFLFDIFEENCYFNLVFEVSLFECYVIVIYFVL